jgi:DNA-binding NtrC family response regulator
LPGVDPMGLVLVVDDEPSIRRVVSLLLGRDGHTVAEAKNGREALRKLELMVFDVVIADLRLGDMHGLDIIRAVRRLERQTEVVMMTASSTSDDAEKALNIGACQVLSKPFTERQLRQSVDAAITRRLLRLQATRTTAGARERSSYGGIVGVSDAMQRMFNMIDIAAPTDHPILLRGSPGSDRERVARVIHESSWRRGKVFASIDCRREENGLLESVLFGHMKGAFSGARRTRRGLLEKAHRGSVFIDGIGGASPMLQLRLLCFLQDGAAGRVGERGARYVDVRLICGTDEDLHSKTKRPRFREDLLSRLETISIQIPPLRRRREDIPLLVRELVTEYAAGTGNGAVAVGEDAMRALTGYDWPGDVAELRRAITHALSVSGGRRMARAHLPRHIQRWSDRWEQMQGPVLSLRDFEREHILEVLEECEGNQAMAARKLQIGRTTLWRKMKEYQE